eukprot:5850131-Alexandrium_andersonii.AAC.1
MRNWAQNIRSRQLCTAPWPTTPPRRPRDWAWKASERRSHSLPPEPRRVGSAGAPIGICGKGA